LLGDIEDMDDDDEDEDDEDVGVGKSTSSLLIAALRLSFFAELVLVSTLSVVLLLGEW